MDGTPPFKEVIVPPLPTVKTFSLHVLSPTQPFPPTPLDKEFSLQVLSKYLGPEVTTAYMSMPTANIIDLVEKYHNENVIKDTQYNGFTDILKKYNYLEHLIQSRQPNYNEVF